jgi:glycosyltransferase involved in cell wall biosynthesis
MDGWPFAKFVARRIPSYGPRVAALVYEAFLPLLLLLRRDTRRSQVVHFTDLSFVFPAGVLAFVLRKRIIVTVQSLGGLSSFSRSNRNLSPGVFDILYRTHVLVGLRTASKVASLLVPVSELINSELPKLGIRKSSQVVYPFVLPPSEAVPSRPLSLVLGFVGALVPWKRAERAIRILSMLKKKDLSCSLVVVGAGPSEKHLAGLARNAGLGSEIEFTGHVSGDMEPHYRKFFVLLLTSRFESFGYPVVEAASVGVPVISFSDALLDRRIRALTIVVRDEVEATEVIEAMWRNDNAYSEVSSRVYEAAKSFRANAEALGLRAIYAQA